MEIRIFKNVRIFSEVLRNETGKSHYDPGQRDEALARLEAEVSEALGKHPDSEVQWLQSSFTDGSGSFTRLTAAMMYN